MLVSYGIIVMNPRGIQSVLRGEIFNSLLTQATGELVITILGPCMFSRQL